MSVQSAVPATQANASRPTSPVRLLLMPELLSAFTPDTAALQRREFLADARAARQRRRDELSDALAPAGTQQMRPVDVQREDLRSGKEPAAARAAAQDARHDSRSHARGREASAPFRQALADAGGRPAANGAGTPESRAALSPVEGEARPGAAGAAGNTAQAARGAAGMSPRGANSQAMPQVATLPGTMSATVPPTASGAATRSAAAAAVAGRASPGIAPVAPVSAAGGTVGTPGPGGGPASPAAAVGTGPQAAQRGAATRGTAPAAQPAPDAGENDANIARFVRLVQARLGHDRSVATLRLDPPALGTLRVRMDLRQANLILEVDTQNDAAQRLLTEQAEHLRQRLEAAGIQLERMEVRAPAAAERAAQDGQPQMQDGGGAAQQEAADRRATQAVRVDGAGDERAEEPAVAESPAGTLEPAAESLVNVLA